VAEFTKDAVTLDALHGDTVVATITITLARSGLMRIDGSITDEKFTAYMLETARETLKNYHAKQKLGQRSPILVPAYDTALVGTPEEKALLAARHDLADAMAGTR
jgi:hypothetical protein